MDNTVKAGQAYAHEVGKKRPNPFGLFDMYGNAWEWCADACAGGVSKRQLPGGVDPLVTVGTDRVLRGGGWDLPSRNYDATGQWGQIEEAGAYNFGLRVCRSPADTR